MLIAKDLYAVESYKTEVEHLREKLKLLKEEQRLKNSGKKGDRSSSLAVTLKKLEVANQKLKDMCATLNNELELAAILQKSLVPDNLSEHEKIKFSFHYEPMGQVGGDYYDVIDIDKNRKGVILADVSGHGVSSAFIAAMLKISFTNYAPHNPSPSDVLGKLNKEYCSVIQTGDYVTAFYAIFDTAKNKITYSGAGHPKPLYQHGKGADVELLSSEGFFIGMFEEAEYQDSVLEFDLGGRFLAYTDGIIEAYSEERNEQFGETRLLKSFIKYQDRSLDQIIQLIIEDVKKFMQKSKFYDDLAIVSVEHKKQGVKNETQ
jgi:serine phosphatase RsbU (regulator of sigma subunit)